MEAEISWQACIYNMYLTFYLLLPIYHSNKISTTVKMYMNVQLTGAAFIWHIDLHVSLHIQSLNINEKVETKVDNPKRRI